ncbi:MAG: 16S rRNA (cytosine(1402)-N(4))-methyltransferase RsmH [Pseudomonadota bacterium]
MNICALNNHYRDHYPVMLHEVVQSLALDKLDNATVIDATFGAGGYTKSLLLHPQVKVFAFDCDPSTKQYADKLTLEFGKRFNYINSNFANLAHEMSISDHNEVNGIVFDLGVSSMQLDHGERGFSFSKEGPLDMRMSNTGKTAADLLAIIDEEDLASIIKNYGEEQQAYRIANKIIEHRDRKPITTTTQLTEIIHSVKKRGGSKIDPATKTYQALRLAVNHELENLESSLEQAWKLLAPGGRMSVVCFHGLEERVLKKFIQKHQKPKVKINKYRPPKNEFIGKSVLNLLGNKSVTPQTSEIEINPRSRSASLRIMIKEVVS